MNVAIQSEFYHSNKLCNTLQKLSVNQACFYLIVTNVNTHSNFESLMTSHVMFDAQIYIKTRGLVFHFGPVQSWCPYLGTKMDVVQTHQCPEPSMFSNN